MDVCSICEDLTVKMRSPLNNNARLAAAAAADILVHKRRAKKFYSKMKSIPERCGDRPVQNVPLPQLPVQEWNVILLDLTHSYVDIRRIS